MFSADCKLQLASRNGEIGGQWVKKAKRTKSALERFQREIGEQQSTIERQIQDAMGQVNKIKERRRKEQKQFQSKEAELRRQIDFHIETARSTESKVIYFFYSLARLNRGLRS